MGKADLLSRRAGYDQGAQDNDNVTFIKDEWLVRGVVTTSRSDVAELVKKAQEGLSETTVP